MIISINIKNGTGGYTDCDGCDFCVTKMICENFPVPRAGEILELLEDNDKKIANSNGKVLKEYHQYLVTNIHYWINDTLDYGVTIYVVPIGRSVDS